MPAPQQVSLPASWQKTVEHFEQAWPRLFQPPKDAPETLVSAMRYSLLAGGKRIRPFLVLASCRLCGGDEDDAMPAAAAIEFVHTFSLIHDDLPAMDDDDLRRGEPANHKVFGEAMALLAGDGLLALAFEVLARHTPSHRRAAEMVGELATGVGWAGMIGGQAADVIGEGQPPSEELVNYIHQHKTARLIEASCRLGAMAAQADQQQLSALSRYGAKLGLAFQITDDLLDVLSTQEVMGKRVGKDATARKQTYPAIVGIGASQRTARGAVTAAIEALKPFGPAGQELAALAEFVVNRAS